MGVLRLRQTESVISTYAADVSGVCSALYEMGGMTVMHDASGCNSTYNTHDEPRWYDTPSMVYISALSELEAVMGDEEKLIADICETAAQLNPRFIAVAGTPIPMMMGTDFSGVARLIERRTGIPAFGFATNGMHSYLLGAGRALAAVAGRFCPDGIRPEGGARPVVNLLGATPLDFSVGGSVEAMGAWLEQEGFAFGCCWAMGSPWEELMQAGRADVNLVVSSCGLPLAHALQKLYGTPYVTGAPFGREFSRRLARQLASAARDGQNRNPLQPERGGQQSGEILLIGEPVSAASLRCVLQEDFGLTGVRIVTPLECPEQLICPGDLFQAQEDDLFEAAARARLVIGDPIYRRVLRGNRKAAFIRWPHEGCTGRIYRREIPVLVGQSANNWLETRL